MKSKKLIFALLLPTLGVTNAATQPDDSWFIRIIAESPSEGLLDRDNVLGQTSVSRAQFDQNDLPELEPFGTPYLSVVFKHDNWGDKPGDYNSDFKNLADQNTTWRFTVKSDDPNRNVTLKWEGEKYLDKMIMVDAMTGQEFYPVIGGRIQKYRFNMDGYTERDFIWKY